MILINKDELQYFHFPNGEVNFDMKQLYAAGSVTLKYENDAEFMLLAMVKDALDRLPDKSDIPLMIPYMPYSRMDRVMGFDSPFTLKTVCNFINSLNFNRVFVYEPHSDVTAALLNRCVVNNKMSELLTTVEDYMDFDPAYDLLFYPDAGAQKRYSGLRDYPYMVGCKHRDPMTGKIDDYSIFGMDDAMQDELFSRTRRVLIVDDLCSGGATFRLAAEALRGRGFKEIFLAIVHCEDNIFERGLLDSGLIDLVYTTTSMIRSKEHEKLIEIQI